jgi:two-component system response regulator FixJ
MPAPQPFLVLIAADDRAVRDSLQFALRLEGFGVRTHSAAEGLLADGGLAWAACVILDDRKPHLDGFAIMAGLRERAMTVPVILLASYVPARLRARAVAAGFHAVLEKPLLNNVLVDTLRAVTGPGTSEMEGGRRASGSRRLGQP